MAHVGIRIWRRSSTSFVARRVSSVTPCLDACVFLVRALNHASPMPMACKHSTLGRCQSHSRCCQRLGTCALSFVVLLFPLENFPNVGGGSAAFECDLTQSPKVDHTALSVEDYLQKVKSTAVRKERRAHPLVTATLEEKHQLRGLIRAINW